MDKITIMPFGDSITNGFTVIGGYRNRLCGLLEENGYKDRVCFAGSDVSGTGYDGHNEGHSGWAVEPIAPEEDVEGAGRDGLMLYADKWLNDAKPDIVLLQIGTNDVLSMYRLEEAENRLEMLTDKILGVLPEYGTLYIALIPYIFEGASYNNTGRNQQELNAVVDRYNRALISVAEKKRCLGYDVIQADINGLLGFGDLSDGVHPTADGYDKMGEFWYSTLKPKIDALLEKNRNMSA